MKLGYSILLGEHIEATAVDYPDCKSFQIVCPACKEPVFKVHRDQTEEQSLHYLSHYEKSASYAAECELRVGSLKTSDIEKSNGEARNQRLEYFLSVLRDAILAREYGGDLRNLRETFRSMKKSEPLKLMRHSFHEYVASTPALNQETNVYTLFDEYVKEMVEISGGFPKTGFSIATQKRIALDVWTHLLSPSAESNFNFVFNNSYLFLLFRIEKSEAMRPLYAFEKRLHSNMFDLIEAKESDGMRIIASMMEYHVPPPHSYNLDLLSKMLAEIQHEIYGSLLRVPYFELLKAQMTSPK